MPRVDGRAAILDSLKSLREQHFLEFCDRLTYPEEDPRIRAAEVDNTSRVKVTNLLVSRCSSGAADRTVRTLRAIGCNQEAKELEDAVRPQPASRRDRSRSPLGPNRTQSPPRRDMSDASQSRYHLRTTAQRDPKALLESVRPHFIDKAPDPVLNQLLDRLRQKRVMTPEEVEAARAASPRAEKARRVVDAVIMKGSRAASLLIREYCELDPCSELCDLLTN